MKKKNDETNNKQNYCTPRFRCTVPFGSPKCEYWEEGFTGDCLWYHRNGYKSCINEDARKAALDKVVEFVRNDGFMDE